MDLRGPRLTIVDHLQVEGLPLVEVIQVLHGNDQAELQDGQSCTVEQDAHHQVSSDTSTGISISGVPPPRHPLPPYRAACSR